MQKRAMVHGAGAEAVERSNPTVTAGGRLLPNKGHFGRISTVAWLQNARS